MSYVCEVLPVGERDYVANGLRFHTEEEAEQYAVELGARWFGFTLYRIVESTVQPNTDGHGKLVS